MRPPAACRSARTDLVPDDLSGPAARYVLSLRDDDPIFDGHYPDFPIFAGVFIVEFAHRAASLSRNESRTIDRLVRVDSARFLSPAFPGDDITFAVGWSDDRAGERVCRCTATVGERAVARIRLVYRTSEQP